MFESSAEAPRIWRFGPSLQGSCGTFSVNVKSPHVGWNQLQLRGDSLLLRGLPQNAYGYFAIPTGRLLVEVTVAACGARWAFSAAVERGRVFGVQFIREIRDSGAEDASQLLRTGDSTVMLTKRIIACLDVDAGRVVKGVQFPPARPRRPGRAGAGPRPGWSR